MGKLTIGILFGGKSAEHEVSLQSAKNVFDALDRNKYTPVLIGIDKSGVWRVGHDASRFILNVDDPKRIALNTEDNLRTDSNDITALVPWNRSSSETPRLDAVFPILHGPFGEDGTVQGMLKLAGLPFVGAGVLGSAAGMDKDVMKRLLREAGLPIGRFLTLRSLAAAPTYCEAIALLGEPLFVKPANMGSSVGINKARNEHEYREAIREAFEYDTKIVIEEYIAGREIECSVLGNEEPIASVPGEVVSSHEFYSYDAKYLDENGAKLEIPAKIPPETAARIQDLAVQTFKTLSCEGLSRVDFFLKENGKVVINEINTMPGFTKISMYPKLWEASGVSYSELIDRLISLAIERFEKEKRLKTSYSASCTSVDEAESAETP